MKDPCVLYSIQSYLAYCINTKFYQDKHYVWCAPFFDSKNESNLPMELPYTSNPADIYKSFWKDITADDAEHERKEIMRNTIGLHKGAMQKLKQGEIGQATYDEVLALIHDALNSMKKDEFFRPLIYVIPFALNEKSIRKVEVGRTAASLFDAYIIHELPTSNFSIIDLGDAFQRKKTGAVPNADRAGTENSLPAQAKRESQSDPVARAQVRIQQLNYEEQIGLFQLLEVIEGIRMGTVTAQGLSKAGLAIIKTGEGFNGKEKEMYIEQVKRLLFDSINSDPKKAK